MFYVLHETEISAAYVYQMNEFAKHNSQIFMIHVAFIDLFSICWFHIDGSLVLFHFHNSRATQSKVTRTNKKDADKRLYSTVQ